MIFTVVYYDGNQLGAVAVYAKDFWGARRRREETNPAHIVQCVVSCTPERVLVCNPE